MIELNGTASIARNIAEARQENGANVNIDTEHMLKHCATEVVEAMEAMAETVDGVYSCKLNSDYNFTNTETREYRYQAVFNLYY